MELRSQQTQRGLGRLSRAVSAFPLALFLCFALNAHANDLGASGFVAPEKTYKIKPPYDPGVQRTVPLVRKPTPISTSRYIREKNLALRKQSAFDPVDYDIHTEEGDVISVRYLPTNFGAASDRCDIRFAVASHITEWKTFVINGGTVVKLNNVDPGPKVVSIYTGFDYESYDNARPSTANDGIRRRAFNRRIITPRRSSAQIALFRGQGMTADERVSIKKIMQLKAKMAKAPVDQELMMPVYPGYQITLTWLKD